MKRRAFLNTLGGAALAAGAAKLSPKKADPMPDTMTVAGVGDMIVSRKVSKRKEPAFLDLVELIRSADCAWGNCEMTLIDIQKGYPGDKGFDMHVTCEPWGADELAWFGVDFVGIANNHMMDYGNEGLFSTIENLKRVGIEYAGGGRDLQEASRPRYVDTPGGRVGQVCCTSSALQWFSAAPSSPYTNGRPGINRLRYDNEIMLESETYETFRGIIRRVYAMMAGRSYEEIEQMMERDAERRKKREAVQKPAKKRKETITFGQSRFIKGEEWGILNKANEKDVKRITEALAIARNNARIVIQSIHAHELDRNIEIPAKFIQPFAQACIDAGADVFFGTGPHLLRGIEIYKGKPIFYSLGNLFFQYGAVKQLAFDTLEAAGLEGDSLDPSQFYARYDRFFKQKKYWESIVPFITYEKGHVAEIRLYPIELGWKEPSYQKGTPMLAGKEQGEKIIQRLVKLSEPYNTNISCRDGVGFVNLEPDSVPIKKGQG
ncbi:MAG: CapA family protein [Candidatus Aminicenantes bacterium]